MSPPSISPSSPPPRPRLVLRLGFAGRKELTDPEQRIVADSLHQVMQTLAKRLSSIAPGTPVSLPRITDHCSLGTSSPPLLRQSDILIAAANPDEPGKAGGTLETVPIQKSAINNHQPVRRSLGEDGSSISRVLAIVAVVLAAASLTLLGTAGHTAVGENITLLLEKGGLHAAKAVVSAKPEPWLLPLLLVLAAGKLGILIFISSNTKRANDLKWNDRAVDTRYLAERLRGMYYLSLFPSKIGNQQSSIVNPPLFTAHCSLGTSSSSLHQMRPSNQPAARLSHQDNCPI